MLWEAGDVAVFALQAGGVGGDGAGVGGDVGLVVLREAGLPDGTSFYVTDNGVQRRMYTKNLDSCAAYFAHNGDDFYENHFKFTAKEDLPFGTVITLQGDDWEPSPANQADFGQLGDTGANYPGYDQIIVYNAADFGNKCASGTLEEATCTQTQPFFLFGSRAAMRSAGRVRRRSTTVTSSIRGSRPSCRAA